MRKNTIINMFSITILMLLLVLFVIACLPKSKSNDYLSVAPVPDLSDHPIYSSYEFGEDDSVIDIGTQPIGVSPGIIGEIFEHDAILRSALAELGFELRIHHFLKGADSNFFLERGDLEVVTGGDMPGALDRGDIDAFSTVEPNTSLALAEYDGFVVIHRSLSTSYLYL